MTPMRALVCATILALAGVAFASSALAGNWEVVHDDSRLGFTAVQTGSDFDGTFEFTADMTFYRDRPEDSAFDVEVDVTSVDTGSRQRDTTLAEKTWFWFEQHPTAHFETKRIRHQQGNQYVAIADLTIKDNTHEVELPFTWEQDGDVATMEGTVTAVMRGGLSMDRTRWDVGTGQWSEGDTIGRQVDVHVDLTLHHVGDG